MSLTPLPAILTQSINLNEFDFDVDRSRIFSSDAHDGSVTIRMPGKNRKTANHELIFIPYFKKNKLKFKTVAIGRSKKKKQNRIVVFDQATLVQHSAIIRKYGKTNGFVNSKGHALKMLEIFNISVPKKANEVVKVFFKLHPTLVNGDKLNYRICTLSLVKVINNDESADHSKRTSQQKSSKKTTPKANKIQLGKGTVESSQKNIL